MMHHDPLAPHAHDPNPEPPHNDPTVTLIWPDGRCLALSPDELRRLPPTTVEDCYIVSTGHGTSGPFAFTGVTMADLLRAHGISQGAWHVAEVLSADGFGTRIWSEEVAHPTDAGPILLAYAVDGQPLSRRAGLVRLIVPGERDDALRQVKWVARIRLL